MEPLRSARWLLRAQSAAGQAWLEKRVVPADGAWRQLLGSSEGRVSAKNDPACAMMRAAQLVTEGRSDRKDCGRGCGAVWRANLAFRQRGTLMDESERRVYGLTRKLALEKFVKVFPNRELRAVSWMLHHGSGLDDELDSELHKWSLKSLLNAKTSKEQEEVDVVFPSRGVYRKLGIDLVWLDQSLGQKLIGTHKTRFNLMMAVLDEMDFLDEEHIRFLLKLVGSFPRCTPRIMMRLWSSLTMNDLSFTKANEELLRYFQNVGKDSSENSRYLRVLRDICAEFSSTALQEPAELQMKNFGFRKEMYLQAAKMFEAINPGISSKTWRFDAGNYEDVFQMAMQDPAVAQLDPDSHVKFMLSLLGGTKGNSRRKHQAHRNLFLRGIDLSLAAKCDIETVETLFEYVLCSPSTARSTAVKILQGMANQVEQMKEADKVSRLQTLAMNTIWRVSIPNHMVALHKKNAGDRLINRDFDEELYQLAKRFRSLKGSHERETERWLDHMAAVISVAFGKPVGNPEAIIRSRILDYFHASMWESVVYAQSPQKCREVIVEMQSKDVQVTDPWIVHYYLFGLLNFRKLDDFMDESVRISKLRELVGNYKALLEAFPRLRANFVTLKSLKIACADLSLEDELKILEQLSSGIRNDEKAMDII